MDTYVSKAARARAREVGNRTRTCKRDVNFAGQRTLRLLEQRDSHSPIDPRRICSRFRVIASRSRPSENIRFQKHIDTPLTYLL